MQPWGLSFLDICMPTGFTFAEYKRHPSVFFQPNGSRRRRKPPKRIQDAIGAKQGWRCAYCDTCLGLKSDREWDHFMPYA